MSVATVDHSGPWSVTDVLALPEDRRYRYELLDTSLVMSPAPGFRHQRASYRLHAALERAARAAASAVEIFEAVNVTVPAGLVVPDLVVLGPGSVRDETVSVDAEAAQLVIELVSPGNKRMDRQIKPGLYAEAGIPGFWRVEFDPAPRLVTYTLDRGRYVEQVTALAGARVALPAPFPVTLDPATLTAP